MNIDGAITLSINGNIDAKLENKKDDKFKNGIFEIDTEKINIQEQGTYFIRILGINKSSLLKVIKTE